MQPMSFSSTTVKNVHTGDDIFGSLFYTARLHPGAAV